MAEPESTPQRVPEGRINRQSARKSDGPATRPAARKSVRLPQIRQKANGAYFVRWGGKDRYLSADQATAEHLYLDPDSTHAASLANYRLWRDRPKDHVIDLMNKASGDARGHQAEQSRPTTIADLARLMLESYDGQERRGDPGGYFRRHLTRFLNLHGTAPLRDVCRIDTRRSFIPPVIAYARALADDLALVPLANKTINHDLTAIKRLFAWGAERGHVPDLAWRGLKRLPTRRGKPIVRTARQLRRDIDAAMAHPDPAIARVGPWLAVNYLTACRPSEVVTLVQMACGWPDARSRRLPERGPGRPELGHILPLLNAEREVIDPSGMVELLVHKNDWRDDSGSRDPITRLLILTPEARAWLGLCRPAWRSLDGYSGAARAAGIGLRPSHCRDSAASHLLATGAGVEDISLILGHAPRGEWPSYGRVAWHALAARAAGLSIGGP